MLWFKPPVCGNLLQQPELTKIAAVTIDSLCAFSKEIGWIPCSISINQMNCLSFIFKPVLKRGLKIQYVHKMLYKRVVAEKS